MASIDLSKYQVRGTELNKEAETSLGDSIKKVLNTEINIFEKKFGSKQKEWFYSEMALLLSAGVDIKSAFEIIEFEMTEKKHQSLIVGIKSDVISGLSIASAMKKHSKIFSNYECESIKIGEETSQLPEVLTELGRYYAAAIKLRRQIVGTLTYPVIVITLAICIVYFMLSTVVPMFGDIFKQTGGQLPATTQFLIKMSNHSSSVFYSLLTLVIGSLALHKKLGNTPVYRRIMSVVVLRIPVVSTLIRKIYLARFCQSMQLLLGAKVLLIEALGLVQNMIEYYPIEEALKTVRKEVLAGKSLHESLSQHDIFPKKLTALIKVSEEVNAPELIFQKLSSQYSDEIEHQQAILGKVIEPFFIIILGLVVGFILVAMYMPLFQLSNGF
jgi:type IV pilus assembly protein PilC